MKKIPTIFERDWNGDRSRVLNVPNPQCDWVFDGEGCATIKLDGACAMIRGGKRYKRREIKDGRKIPEGFIPVDYEIFAETSVGWVPVGDGPEDQYFREARGGSADGTYELVGPNVQGGVEKLFKWHELIPHGMLGPTEEPPRTFDALRDWLCGRDIEGLVFRHPDGRMAKIKLRDFGLKRGDAPTSSVSKPVENPHA